MLFTDLPGSTLNVSVKSYGTAGNTLRLWHHVRSDGGGSLHNRRPAVSTNPCAVTVTFYSQQGTSIRVPDPSSNLRSSSTRSRPFRSAPRCAPSELEEEYVPNGDRFIASCRIHRFLFGERIALNQAAAILIPKFPRLIAHIANDRTAH